MSNGFVRVAASTPPLQVANCSVNAAHLVQAAIKAAELDVQVLLTPELGLTGYTCGDLFSQPLLTDGALHALGTVCNQTKALDLMLVVGLPLFHRGKLYNCAAVVQHGQVLGVVPKTHLPNYSEFYELRQFTPAFDGIDTINQSFMQNVPIGTSLLFQCANLPELCFAVEICEDLWVPSPPSARHAMAGATLILNPSASNETIGKADFRRELVRGQSGRLVCAYVYADAGQGESTTDLVFSGHNLVAENGKLLAETLPFSEGLCYTDIDVQRLVFERGRLTTYPPLQNEGYRHIAFSLAAGSEEIVRDVSPTPFVPQNTTELDDRCEVIFSIQAEGLRKRLEHTGANTAVLGISGGLDSALALLATCRTMEKMGRPATDILAVTMPAMGTTRHTHTNAERLCQAVGATLLNVDIRATVRSHFDDIGHSESVTDVVYENAQARVRTLALMDLANQHKGLVVGTGDLSELALGWATYNGDHMSMYGINTSVPKTLVRYMVAHEAATKPALADVLQDILSTPVSPELLPPDDGKISQQTEEIVGPYELHDFFLYYMLRWGFAPRKIYYLAQSAFAGRHDRPAILKWMHVFYRRFFAQQFKRNCLPDGPKVGSVSLSPRGDWRMPSDASAALWLLQIEELQHP